MKELFTKVRGTHETEYNSLGLIIAPVVTSSGSLGIVMESTLEAATWQEIWLLAEGLTQHTVAF